MEILLNFFLIFAFFCQIYKNFTDKTYTVFTFSYLYTLKRHYAVHYAMIARILKSEMIFKVKPVLFVQPKIKNFP